MIQKAWTQVPASKWKKCQLLCENSRMAGSIQLSVTFEIKVNCEDFFINKCDVRLLSKMQCFKCKKKGIYNYMPRNPHFYNKINSSFPFEDQGPRRRDFLWVEGQLWISWDPFLQKKQLLPFWSDGEISYGWRDSYGWGGTEAHVPISSHIDQNCLVLQ